MALVKIFVGEDAFEKANRFIDERELSTAERFVTVKSDNFKYPGGPKVGGRVYWEEHSSSLLPIQFDGVPFQFVGRQIRECWKGPDRHQSDKLKSTRNKPKSEHGYEEKSRKLVHSTKKDGCRASIILRSVICFPDYKIDSNSDYQKKVKRALLNKSIPSSDVNWGVRVYVSVPNESCHNHITGEFSSVYQRLDQTIIDRIHSLVGDGVRRIDEMERAIFGYSKRQFPTATPLNSRFYPSRKIIRNHMYSAMCVQQFSSDDFENLKKHVEQWKSEHPKDNFYYTSGPQAFTNDDKEERIDVEEFLFVHQSYEQKRLLERYGKEICLLDATYKTCKFEVPLFFLCVSTNSGYIVVGSFVLPTETTYHIKRGLEVLKRWNPTWDPSYFITDYDRKEINAIDEIFPGCFTFLCDFHREQSWKRWVGPSNGVTNVTEVLALLRSIANASNHQSYTDAVDALRTSSYWTDNKLLRDWFQTYWLKESKRWVQYHRQSLLNKRVNTTNGVERQNRDFKQNYLGYYTEGSLTLMITTLVTRYIPDACRRYVKQNLEWLSKNYSADIPEFLNCKSRAFIKHCMDRITVDPAVIEVNQTGEHMFTTTSATSGRQYNIDLAGILPSCTCLDWGKYHLPCKHMLHIIMHVPEHGWESLSEEFRNAPHHSSSSCATRQSRH